MTGNDILTVVRQRIADTDAINCTNDFILQNINAAIEYLSKLLISRKAACMIDVRKVIDYTHCPIGFHSFVGNPPLFLEGNIIRSYNGRIPVNMRYWRLREPIKVLEDIVPFDEDYKEELVTCTAMLCLNKDEFSTEFEQSVLNSLSQYEPGKESTNETGN